MFGWLLGGKRYKVLEEKTQEGFFAVKKDINTVGKWIKHLNSTDKQLFDLLNEVQREISSMKDEIGGLREGIELANQKRKDKQVFENLAAERKQVGVGGVEKVVQTAVQTGNIYDILRGLTANERLVVFTLLNSDMKLSYEDLALLLGKERSTIRGQVNSIKQKSEFIREITEKNGKKRVFIPEEIKEKLTKYAKVRVGKGGRVN